MFSFPGRHVFFCLASIFRKTQPLSLHTQGQLWLHPLALATFSTRFFIFFRHLHLRIQDWWLEVIADFKNFPKVSGVKI